jgi:uncharacterized membrane protein
VIAGNAHDRLEVLVVTLPDSDVSRIDAVFRQSPCALGIIPQQDVPVVVEVSDNRDPDPAVLETCRDLADGAGRFRRIDGHSDELGARAGQGFDLRHGGGDIRRVGVGHRLDSHGLASADADSTHVDLERSVPPGHERIIASAGLLLNSPSMFGVPLHPLAVHFPIALATFAFVYDAWGVYSNQPRFHTLGSSLLKLAAVGAIVGLGSGISLAGMSGLGSRSTVTGHAGLGLAATIVLSALAFTRHAAEARHERPEREFRAAWLAVEGAGAGLVVATALIGHRI